MRLAHPLRRGDELSSNIETEEPDCRVILKGWISLGPILTGMERLTDRGMRVCEFGDLQVVFRRNPRFAGWWRLSKCIR